MITKTIKIGTLDVKMAVSAGTARRYRAEFGSDMFADLAPMSSGQLDAGILEQMAYVMAKQANPDISLSFDEWLDQFGMFDLMNASTDIVELWVKNTRQNSESKKK